LAGAIAVVTAACQTTPQDEKRSLAIAAEVERLATGRVLWPGFDPLTVPLAIFDGNRTYLFRHPKPPQGFSPLANARPAAFVLQGRDSAVTSNSSAEIGGVMTATLLADGAREDLSSTQLAATAIHESFHVYQRQRHPGWSANEGGLFLYPVDNGELLALRRLESAALRRALGATDSAQTACWVRSALGFRDQRFAGTDSAFSTYERLTELNEGLATYVELVAAGQTTVEIPPDEFPATRVRDRSYAIGPALAFLLDRVRPDWKAQLEGDDKQVLDLMLRSAVGEADNARDTACSLTSAEVASLEATALDDAEKVMAARTERRREFDDKTGWRVVVRAAPGHPLWPQGFDPLNVERVEGGVLHSRFLKLGNDVGSLQVIDEAGVDLEALTVGAGAHPLFNGVETVTVAGLAKLPEILTEGQSLRINAPGLAVDLKKAIAYVVSTDVLVQIQ
jgi:hypothetical protein